MGKQLLRLLAFNVVLAAFAPHALAQDNVGKAAVLAREAEKLIADGKVAEGCDKLEESQALDPRGGTLLDLALCRDKEGRTGTAYNLLEAAEKALIQEKKTDRATTAKAKKNALYLKLPRLTVNVPKDAAVAGLEIRAGKQVIPESEWGKPYPVDPGTLKVTATAPQKAPWETTVELRAGLRKVVAVPVLKAAGATTAPTGDNGTKTEPKTEPKDDKGTPKPDEKKDDEKKDETPKPTPDGGAKHESGRIVVDIAALAGLHVSAISQSSQDLITGTDYRYAVEGDNEIIGACGDTVSVPGAGDCDATYNPQVGLMLGGQAFIGYGFTDGFQLGGRVMGGAHIPTGYIIVGGPSISFRVSDPFWMGISLLAGTSSIEATVTGARGSVPEEFQTANGGDQVDIPARNLTGGLAGGDKTADASGELELGGSLEVSFVLADMPTGTASGSLLLSAYPTALWSPGHGVVFAVPVGIGYRFY